MGVLESRTRHGCASAESLMGAPGKYTTYNASHGRRRQARGVLAMLAEIEKALNSDRTPEAERDALKAKACELRERVEPRSTTRRTTDARV